MYTATRSLMLGDYGHRRHQACWSPRCSLSSEGTSFRREAAVSYRREMAEPARYAGTGRRDAAQTSLDRTEHFAFESDALVVHDLVAHCRKERQRARRTLRMRATRLDQSFRAQSGERLSVAVTSASRRQGRRTRRAQCGAPQHQGDRAPSVPGEQCWSIYSGSKRMRGAVMWLVFVDDTKQRGLRKGMGQLLALAAVAFREDRVQQYAEKVGEIYRAYGVPEGTEFEMEHSKGFLVQGTGGRSGPSFGRSAGRPLSTPKPGPARWFSISVARASKVNLQKRAYWSTSTNA